MRRLRRRIFLCSPPPGACPPKRPAAPWRLGGQARGSSEWLLCWRLAEHMCYVVRVACGVWRVAWRVAWRVLCVVCCVLCVVCGDGV